MTLWIHFIFKTLKLQNSEIIRMGSVIQEFLKKEKSQFIILLKL
jgi:hypothetical protein